MAASIFDLVEEQLNPRQKAFIDEYLIDLDASAAAIRAGYSSNSAHSIGSALVSRLERQIEAAKAQRASRVTMTADSVLHEMSLLANSNLEHYIIDDTGNVTLAPGAPAGAMRAISSIKKRTTVKMDKDGGSSVHYDVEIRLWDKPTPLRLMGRHVNLFSERVEHTGPGGAPIETVTKIERVVVHPPKE